ncbi:hypothetical protein [Brevibacillus halotolerans]|uniref:hypothetical protein n=1 Tax=Brevibacillus halotolerans TaxID=1507437 RepID=UPI001FCF9D95|nr:hypothetical protein [Brevibacillus halotolerans]
MKVLGNITPLSIETLNDNKKRQEKRIRRLSDDELYKRAKISEENQVKEMSHQLLTKEILMLPNMRKEEQKVFANFAKKKHLSKIKMMSLIWKLIIYNGFLDMGQIQ